MRDELAERRRQRDRERRERDAFRGRLGRGRFDALVKQLVMATRQAFEEGAIASKFGLEGPLRHSLRAELCLQSWRWKDADDMARELLAETYKLLRAERPSWHEGQREWTLEAGTLIERTRCARCHKPLPEGHHKFCGPTCATTYHSRLSRIRDGDERDAIRIATRVLT